MRSWWLVLLLMAGCGTDETSTAADAGVDSGTNGADVGTDSGDLADVAQDVLLDVSADSGEPALPVVAENYCELTADMFCDYYLRCGRIAAADKTECLTIFNEQCNTVYEPHYRAVAELGALELSESGMLACQAHLETVACEKQLFDLDGACVGMWVGKVPAGGPCAPGIESFVCQPSATCVLGLDLCGTCEAAVDVGEFCGDGVRCNDGLACVEGLCVRRGEVGDVCDASRPCRVGTGCVEGVCSGFDVVEVGQACGQGARCPYASFCSEGVCVRSKAVGESCTPADECRSGFCDLGICQPFRADGAACNTGPQCISGVCDQGTCGALPGACFDAN